MSQTTPAVEPVPSIAQFLAAILAINTARDINADAELNCIQATARKMQDARTAEQHAEWWHQLGAAVKKMKESAEELQNLCDNLSGQGLAGTEAMTFIWNQGFPEEAMSDLYDASYALDDLIEPVENWVNENNPANKEDET